MTETSERDQLLNTINTKLDVLISQHGNHAAVIGDHETRIRAGEAGHLETRAAVLELAKDVADLEARQRATESAQIEQKSTVKQHSEALGEMRQEQESSKRWRYALPVSAVAGLGGILGGGAAIITAIK